MKLRQLMADAPCHLVAGEAEVEITSICYDSRKVQNGSLFVAICGFQTDGHRYIDQAVAAGAAAVAVERDIQAPEGVAVLKSENNRILLAALAAAFYCHPSRQFRLIGVTGTNGKTSTTYLLKKILEEDGRKVGLIGTIQNLIGNEVIHADHTTPESLELQALFAHMAQEGATDVVMEVSSHALALHRVDYSDFDVAVLTNLTQDHLDYHKTMTAYRDAKARLFSMAKDAVLNKDDPVGAYMAGFVKGRKLFYSLHEGADLWAGDIRMNAEGVWFTLHTRENAVDAYLHTPGRFSIDNGLAAAGAARMLGISLERIAEGLRDVPGVRGRFEPVKSPTGLMTVVDYAHTPDGLINILKTAREFVTGRIITVFGCGGDRDHDKRPLMGRAAGEGSQYCILTSDNPRTEDPKAIMREAEVGLKETGCPYEVVENRREAIGRAIALQKAGDLVIVAGKGHEDYQIFASGTIHFDDVEEVRKVYQEENK